MNGKPTAAAAGSIDMGGDLTVNRMGFGAMRCPAEILGPCRAQILGPAALKWPASPRLPASALDIRPDQAASS